MLRVVQGKVEAHRSPKIPWESTLLVIEISQGLESWVNLAELILFHQKGNNRVELISQNPATLKVELLCHQ